MPVIKRLSQNGDTIVEVLISLAIVGLAFGVAYATANKSLLLARNSEEHSQALEFIGKDLELLRSAATNDDANAPTGIFGQNNQPFCPVVTGYPVRVVYFSPGWVPLNHDANSDDFTKYPAECTENGLYHLSVVYCPNGSPANSDMCVPGPSGSQDEFQVLVRWDGIGDLGRQQELISYRIHP